MTSPKCSAAHSVPACSQSQRQLSRVKRVRIVFGISLGRIDGETLRPIGREVKGPQEIAEQIAAGWSPKRARGGWVKSKLKLKSRSNLKCAGVLHSIAFRGVPCCAVAQRKEVGCDISEVLGSVRISARAQLIKTVTNWTEVAESARLIIISIQQ